IPATRAALERPEHVAALPGGGVLVVDAGIRLDEVGPDGLIRRIAGGGTREARPDGQPATTLRLIINGAAPAPDGGTVLSTDHGTARLPPDGRLTPVRRPDSSAQIAALPDGGYAFAEIRTDPATLDDHTRVLRVAPDGRTTVLVGSGPLP